MNISIINQQRDLRVLKPEVVQAIQDLLSFLKIETDEVSVHFVTEKKISLLHKKNFNDPSPTDCITFPIDGKKKKGKDFHLLGEVFICPRTAMNYAKKMGKNPYDELTLYLVHGLLHLIGYDDISEEERKKMRKQEKKCLNLLNKNKHSLRGS